MSKNLTRKGLAFGAVLALGSTLITGTAASAVEAVSLEPAEGTTYNVPLASGFTLKALFTDAAQLGAEAVKFRVVDSESKLDVTGANGAADASGYSDSYSATTNLPTQANITEITDADSDGVFFVSGNSTVAPTASYLYLLPGSSTTTFSVTAQAFMDLDGDNVIDSGEAASEVRTIKFVADADITATSVVDAYGLGDSKITASVKTTPVLNGAQLADNNNVSTTITGKVTNAVSTDVFDGTQTKWDETNQEWDVTTQLPSVTQTAVASSTTAGEVIFTSTAHGLLVGETVKVTGITAQTAANVTAAITAKSNDTFTYKAAGVVLSTTTPMTGTGVAQVVVGANTYSFKPFKGATSLGDAVASTVGAAKAATATSTADENGNQYKVTGTDTLTVTVRKGQTASASYAVVDADGASVGAGKSVRITVSGVTGTLKVNGSSTAAANTNVINAITDSNGKVAISVATTSAGATDAITLTAVAEGVAATSEAITFNWAASVYEIVDLNDSAVFGTPGTVRAAAKGGSYAFNLSVTDQWGNAIDGATYRVLATVTGRTAWTKSATISGGKATVSVEDGALTTGDATVALNIQKLVSGTWTTNAVDADVVDWDQANQTAANGEEGNVLVKFYDQTDALALNADAVSNADLSVTRSATATKAVDRRVSGNEAFDTTGLDAATITGTVSNAITGVSKAGASVTVSGDSNILFVSGGVSKFGSITLIDADGSFSVDAYSNKVLTDSVVTVTSGSVSKTVKVSFIASTSAADIKSVTVTGATSIKSGRTTVLTVALADKYGNAVANAGAISVVNDGPGYLSSYPAAVAATGKVSVVLITGSADGGLATITVTSAGPNGTIGTGDDDITVTKSVLVGVSAKITKATTSKVTVKNANGLTVKVVRGTKSVTKTASSDSYNVSLKGGKGTVKVYVNGVLVASK
jgi:hypothetical protein